MFVFFLFVACVCVFQHGVSVFQSQVLSLVLARSALHLFAPSKLLVTGCRIAHARTNDLVSIFVGLYLTRLNTLKSRIVCYHTHSMFGHVKTSFEEKDINLVKFA